MTTRVEEEEGVEPYWLTHFYTTPSIRLQANQDTMKDTVKKASDWPVH